MNPPARPRLKLAELESREVPSAAPTVAEQVFLERLNDARADPAAYGRSVGVDLSGVAPSQPLAFDPRLVEAARQHSQDMSDRAYFGHVGPDGRDPAARLTAAGYPWRTWAESIAAGYATPEDTLKALVVDAGVSDLAHRKQLLSIGAAYQGEREVGVGLVQGGSGPYHDYATVDAGSTADARPYLTGVVYRDLNHNGRYDTGEGIAGARVSVPGVGSVTTWTTGGYSLRLNPGSYTVTASGGGLAAAVVETVTVGADNRRLSFIEGTNPAPAPKVSPPPPVSPPVVAAPLAAQPNHAPVLQPVVNHTVRTGASLAVPLFATDADGNKLTYSATVQSDAYALDQQFGFRSAGSLYTNWWGRGEKWFLGRGGWYFIQPNGEVWQVGTSAATRTRIATLPTAYYRDPSKLFNATPGARVSVSGNSLTVAPEAGFVGRLTVSVTVRDGRGGSATRAFTVTVG